MSYNNITSNAYVIKDFLSQIFSIKFYYILSFIVLAGLAFMLNRYSPVVYEVNSIIGPIEDQRPALLGSNDLFRGLVSYEQARNLENDINNINSFTLVSNTLSKMNLEVGYFVRKKNILDHDVQLYPDPPFHVSIDKSHNQPINAQFDLSIIDNSYYKIKLEGEEVALYNYVDNAVISDKNIISIDTICKFNEPVSNKYFRFVVSLTDNSIVKRATEQSNQYYFILYNTDDLARSFLERIKVEPVSVRSSLINITVHGQNLDLTTDFLNAYVQNFLDNNLSKKNKMSANAVSFIDQQISGISDSLDVSENKLRNYRSANQVMDLSYQGQRAFEQISQVESDKMNLEIQKRYYNSLLQYFEKNSDISGIAPPTAANINDPIINRLILDLHELNTQRTNVMSKSEEKNLFLGQIDNKIRLQKQAIIENVRNNLNTLEMTGNELDYRSQKLSQEISRLPRTELNMVSMQRKFDVSDAIYTFLLQKRTEAAITMASNHPDYEILEPARKMTRTIIAPKPMVNYLFAIFFALLLPTGFLLLKNFFNENITRFNEAEYILKRPVLSIIYSNPHKTEAVVTEAPSSPVAESFRNLRSRLFLKFKAKELKTIMITSSQPKDGKSFVSYNLAASIAGVGHKTVLVDCDLRRPALHHIIKTKNELGITNYLADNVSKERIIHDTNTENLYFIPAGPALANSSEMIEAGSLDDLILWLKNNFSYVIIDSPPMGIVAEATQLVKYSSHILLVCRNNYTRKDVYTDVLNIFRTNKIENFDVVFNDMSIDRSKYGHYRDYYYKNVD
ncbi:MAG TPA: polysaccharide biosynthesis tyrosine autokinase [Bacteroidales bacterium]|nr:polysaccharide biosynthesis tyrosine autokinase [Bacteroidales bacterium]